MKVNIFKNRLAMWFVTSAIKDNWKIIDDFNIENQEDLEINFTVNGVELNFLNVINRIEELFDKTVEKRAGEMYLEKYDRRSDEITEELENISERLKEIRRTKFPEINWGNDQL